MSVHVKVVLTVHETFIKRRAVKILIESILDKLSWYGRNAKDLLMPIDVSRLLDLLAWDMLSRV